MLYACFIFARRLLDVCSMSARCLFDVCLMIAWSCKRESITYMKQTSSKLRASTEQLEHTSCTCISNAFPRCLFDDYSMFAWSCKRGICDCEYRQGAEWYRPRRVLSRKMLPLNEVLAYVDVMDQVADDFVHRLRQVRHQLIEDSSTTLEHELLQFGIECTFNLVSLPQKCEPRLFFLIWF